MPVSAEHIKHLISKAFPDAEIKLVDTAGDENHYALTVISSVFCGKNRIEQHKMVMKALGECVGNELHALQIKTITKR